MRLEPFAEKVKKKLERKVFFCAGPWVMLVGARLTCPFNLGWLICLVEFNCLNLSQTAGVLNSVSMVVITLSEASLGDRAAIPAAHI